MLTESELNGDALPTEESKQLLEKIIQKEKLKDFNLTLTRPSTKGDNFFGEIYKIQVVGKTENHNHEKFNFILKMAPYKPTLRESVPINRYYCREINQYLKVLPELGKIQNCLPKSDQFKYASCYGVCEKDCKETIVVEDLCALGYKVYDRIVSLDHPHISIAIVNLARFHAASFVMRQLNPELFGNLTKDICKGLDYGIHFNKFIDQNRKQFLECMKETQHHDRFSAYLENMEEKLEKYLDPFTTEPFNVICHGDCWTSNLLFKYENDKLVDLMMVDWQMSRLASPVTDIAYLLFTSTDENLRHKHFYDIIDMYYDTLRRNITAMGCDINICYPRNVYNTHLKSILPYGLMISIVLCPVLLCDRDQTPDLAKANESYTDNKESSIKFSKTPKQRLQGGALDCIKYDLL